MPGAETAFAIGSERWPGLSKVIEECGEVLQVAGKLIATGGEPEHWDGSDLRVRLMDEIADALAALTFFTCHSFTFEEYLQINDRAIEKCDRFDEWQRQPERKAAAL